MPAFDVGALSLEDGIFFAIGAMVMKRSDSQLLDSVARGDEATLVVLLDAFERGDRRAYNLLVRLLKVSDVHVEKALRVPFSEGNGLVAELVCQAYYPFVEVICGYKFAGRSSQDITEITNDILSDFIRQAAHLDKGISFKNQLYQRVCAKFKAVKAREAKAAKKQGESAKPEVPLAGAVGEVLSPAHPREVKNDSPQPKPELVGKLRDGAQADDKKAVPAAGAAQAQKQQPKTKLADKVGSLPPAKKHRSGSVDKSNLQINALLTPGDRTKKQDEAGLIRTKSPKNEPAPSDVASKNAPVPSDNRAAASAKAATASPSSEDSASILPPLPGAEDKKRLAPLVTGHPSDSKEVMAWGPYGEKLTFSLANLAERDFDTYKIVVLHYFKGKGYQELCRDLGGTSLITVGKRLCRGLVELGRDIFGL